MIDNKEKSNSYLKFNEMRTYFDLEDWQLLYICERQKKSSNINTITNSYIFARKKNNRKNKKKKKILLLCQTIIYKIKN